MKTFEVKTGFGYITDKDGHIVSKYELRKGVHSIKDDVTMHEVATKAELDIIEIYVPPETPDEIKEKKIRAEMNKILRDQAIASLTAKGEL